jgi:uncharacterized repeat protein (TIGR03803 family)
MRILTGFVCACAAATSLGAAESVLHSFAYLADGANPRANLFRDSAGNLYGTTATGGTGNAGVVYRVAPSGVQTVLYTFTGGADGGAPQAGVFVAASGTIYGTASQGGSSGQGVVFRLSTTGQETVMYSFTGGSDGGRPYSGVSLDAQGNVYGTTVAGGTAGLGVVYQVTAAGKETVLHSFAGAPSDGAQPYGGVVRDTLGNTWGATSGGGAENLGAVFQINSAGQETILYSFGANGFRPLSGVVRDASGNLYGTTAFAIGGAGTVYKLDSSGNETVLHLFTGGSDGGQPNAGVVLDSAGNLYGTAVTGGATGAGVVFQVDTSGDESVLCAFNGTNGGAPYAGVILDSSDNLYGAASDGGSTGLGVVYEVNSSGNQTLLYTFGGGSDGYTPLANLVRDSAGNFYGTTAYGGPGNAGVVFQVAPNGKETILYSFTGGADGSNPDAGLILDSAGNLYGTTSSGGAHRSGAVFEVSPSGQETVLYSFTGGKDGGTPECTLVFDSAGNLYGTASAGGADGAGVVFELSATGQETVLYSFNGKNDGGRPLSGVIRDSSGNLYGTTPTGGYADYGVVYKVDSGGTETVIYSFKGLADGGSPQAGLYRDSAGNLYGTTTAGGTSTSGTIFKITPQRIETVLYNFTGGADGSLPYAGLVRDSAGNFYGTTYYGGASGAGVVYELSAAGQESVLYSFTGGSDGKEPFGGVILDSSGDVFGTTSAGGSKLGGVVFKITR